MNDNNDLLKAEVDPEVKTKVEGWVTKNKPFAIKQTEMLQSVITRMANNSLEAKKFGLTVWAAMVGFGIDKSNRWFFILAFITFILFGIFDIYYLYQERKFRDNFNRLTRMINGCVISGDETWIKQGNFLKPDYSSDKLSDKFLGQIPKMLASWANLPYLFTLLITIGLCVVPLSGKP